MTGNGRERYPLAQNMAASFAAFAKTGNPNHAGIPQWPAFDPTRRATMVFDTQTAVVNDPYGEERRAVAALRARRTTGTGA
jgi:para-nitrobenzyl esterase